MISEKRAAAPAETSVRPTYGAIPLLKRLAETGQRGSVRGRGGVTERATSLEEPPRDVPRGDAVSDCGVDDVRHHLGSTRGTVREEVGGADGGSTEYRPVEKKGETQQIPAQSAQRRAGRLLGVPIEVREAAARGGEQQRERAAVVLRREATDVACTQAGRVNVVNPQVHLPAAARRRGRGRRRRPAPCCRARGCAAPRRGESRARTAPNPRRAATCAVAGRSRRARPRRPAPDRA